jgi:hypothetical protein
MNENERQQKIYKYIFSRGQFCCGNKKPQKFGRVISTSTNEETFTRIQYFCE